MPVRELKPLTLDPTLDLWDRQPRETVLRYNQFCAYRDLGRTRTLRKVAQALSLSHAYLWSVSAAMHWVSRCEAWDRHRDDLHQTEWLKARREAADNDAKVLDAVIGKVAARLRTLQAETLEPAEVIRLLDVAMRHRRALFGDPIATVAVTGPGGDPLTVQLADLAGMTVEQRRSEIVALADAVKRRVSAADAVDDD